MVESLYLDLKARPDLEVISRLVDPGHRVLDLGCGDGIFLKMLREKRGAVSFINFGHFHCRRQLMLAGSMPRTTQIPYQWYNTPNIHLGTIRDFRRLCRHLGIRIVQEIPIGFSFPLLTAAWPNLFAVGCVFVIERAN